MQQYDDLVGAVAFDWFEVRSPVEPRDGVWWQSVGGKRYERVGSVGELRAAKMKQHGRFVCTLTGEPLRNGASVREFLADVWPGAPLEAQRIDIAWQAAGTDVCGAVVRAGVVAPSLTEIATEVHRRLGLYQPCRYGWGFRLDQSEGGWTYYVGQLNREGLHSDARSGDLYVRCYQMFRPAVAPVRVELEFKQLGGRPLADAVAACGDIAQKILPGRPAWSVNLGEAGKTRVDGRALPRKLLKQAIGLIMAAGRRAGVDPGDAWDEETAKMWSLIVHRMTGMYWEDPNLQGVRGGAWIPGLVIQGSGEGPGERAQGGVPPDFDMYAPGAHVGVPRGTLMAEPPPTAFWKRYEAMQARTRTPGSSVRNLHSEQPATLEELLILREEQRRRRESKR